MKPLSEIAREALGIVATFGVLGFFGTVLNGQSYLLTTGSGLFALAVTFIVAYACVFLWAFWYYRK